MKYSKEKIPEIIETALENVPNPLRVDAKDYSKASYEITSYWKGQGHTIHEPIFQTFVTKKQLAVSLSGEEKTPSGRKWHIDIYYDPDAEE